MNRLLNMVTFQVAWWALIWGVGEGLEMTALIFGIAMMLVNLYWSPARVLNLCLGLVVMLMGIVVDSLLIYCQVIQFKGQAWGIFSPFWLWLLWFHFGLTIHCSLAFLKNQSLLALSLVGTVMGPASYIAGARLGAATLMVDPTSMVVLAAAWTLAFPSVVMVGKWFHRSSQEVT